MRKLHQREHVVDPLARRLARELGAHAERKADIVGDGHVGEQRIGLEYHADIALVRRHVGDRALVEQDVAGIGREKAGDQVERGGLAGAARAQQRHEGAGRNVERDLIDRLGGAEGFCELTQAKLRTACFPRDGRFGHWHR